MGEPSAGQPIYEARCALQQADLLHGDEQDREGRRRRQAIGDPEDQRCGPGGLEQETKSQDREGELADGRQGHVDDDAGDRGRSPHLGPAQQAIGGNLAPQARHREQRIGGFADPIEVRHAAQGGTPSARQDDLPGPGIQDHGKEMKKPGQHQAETRLGQQ